MLLLEKDYTSLRYYFTRRGISCDKDIENEEKRWEERKEPCTAAFSHRWCFCHSLRD